MSAIAKKLTTAMFAVSLLGASAAAAQDMNADFFSNLTSPDKGVAQDDSALLATIEKMMKTVSEMEVDTSSGDSVTIEEIDLRNRAAQRLKNDLAIRELKFKEMQAKVDMLLMLETARQDLLVKTQEKREIEKEASAPDVDPRDILEAEKRAAQEAAAATAAEFEQMSIPRVVSIVGAAGKYSARIESVTGVVQDVKPGSIIVNGFRVDDIGIDGVTLKGDATGRSYFVVPAETAARPSSNGSNGSNEMLPAIDMGGAPGMSGMF